VLKELWHSCIKEQCGSGEQQLLAVRVYLRTDV